MVRVAGGYLNVKKKKHGQYCNKKWIPSGNQTSAGKKPEVALLDRLPQMFMIKKPGIPYEMAITGTIPPIVRGAPIIKALVISRTFPIFEVGWSSNGFTE